MKRFAIVTVASLVAISGCVQSRVDSLAQGVARWPPVSGNTRPTSIQLQVVMYSAVGEGTPQRYDTDYAEIHSWGIQTTTVGGMVYAIPSETSMVMETGRRPLLEQTTKAYGDSRLFSLEDGTNHDFEVSVDMVDRQSVFPVLLSCATLFLVPSRILRHVELHTSIHDRKGERVFETTKATAYGGWVHLFTLPFLDYRHDRDVAIYDLNRATIAEAWGAGVFDVRG